MRNSNSTEHGSIKSRLYVKHFVRKVSCENNYLGQVGVFIDFFNFQVSLLLSSSSLLASLRGGRRECNHVVDETDGLYLEDCEILLILSQHEQFFVVIEEDFSGMISEQFGNTFHESTSSIKLQEKLTRISIIMLMYVDVLLRAGSYTEVKYLLSSTTERINMLAPKI